MIWLPISCAAKTEDHRILVSDGKQAATAEFMNGRWVASPVQWEGSDERGGLADISFEISRWMEIPNLGIKGDFVP